MTESDRAKRGRLGAAAWLSVSILSGTCSMAPGVSAAPAPVAASETPKPAPNSGLGQSGAVNSQTGRALSLGECIARALRVNSSVTEARARIRQVEAQLRQAQTAPYSEFSSRGGIAVAPTLRGTNVYSPDSDLSLSNNMALGWQVGVNGTLPIWTFGKISGTIEAAKANVRVKQEELQVTRSGIRLAVQKAYYGALMAGEVGRLLVDVLKRLDKEVRRLEVVVEEEDADEVPLFKLRLERAKLLVRRSELERQEAVALAGLRFLLHTKEPVAVLSIPLPSPKGLLHPLNYYQSLARAQRPELAMARAGLRARAAQLKVKEAAPYPDLGLSISAAWQRAPEVTDQVNPFVRDPGNLLRYGAALGLTWKLDFLPKMARIDQAKGQLEEMKATFSYAEGGIAAEVERSYLEVTDYAAREKLVEQSVKHAKQWLVTVQQGVDIGITDGNEVIAPASEYAQQRFNLLQVRYEKLLALSRLAQATGTANLAQLGFTAEGAEPR